MDQYNTDPVSPPQVTEIKQSSRDDIRTAILDAKSEDEVITVFGVQIEIRAPDLEGLLQYRDSQNDDSVMARSIVNTCYVPGTGDKVFDETDIPSLMKRKFSPDMKKLIGAINKVLGGDEEVQKKIQEETFPDKA